MGQVSDDPTRQAPYRRPQQARSRATLMRLLEAAEELLMSVGTEELTMNAVAERAGVSVGSIYRRFEGKDQLVSALRERILEQLDEGLAERIRVARPSLAGVVDAYVHALVRSYTAASRLIVSLLAVTGTEKSGSLGRGMTTIAELSRVLSDAAAPYTDQIRRRDPAAALDLVARSVIGTCAHTAVRPDRPADEEGWTRLADQLSDMGLAYLTTPDRPRDGQPGT
ncbi:TetR/AcrR family transcriptional regulator [Streptomyces sp. 8L]|uniref:TetR/AcrR family transcriptional regulator n=1 Tax=Streptomyces sp. 8L TaxID=2877242 RepID=UPI001CD59B6F|nr:TetR/AcrR family transcriptional regulator [Streptomyces sp. 8L]MCA1218269.1 TetR/AcrR family transcriptional regulator [Streptomyces sp. 8L]